MTLLSFIIFTACKKFKAKGILNPLSSNNIIFLTYSTSNCIDFYVFSLINSFLIKLVAIYL